MKKLATLFCLGMLTSCSLLQEVVRDEVVTTQDNVKPEYKGTEIVVPVGWLNKDDQEALKKADKLLVIVDKAAVKDPNAPAIPLDKPTDTQDVIGSVVDVGLEIGKVFFPGLAGLEALGLMFSRRKRSHYLDAIKALAPTDGTVDLKGAVVSLVRGLGLAHSSVGTKEVFADEKAGLLEKVAGRMDEVKSAE